MEALTDAVQIDIRQTPLLFAVTLLSNDAVAKKTVTEESENAKTVLTSTKELVSNAVLRFLEDRGYINNDHTLSAWGKALKASLNKAKENGYMHAVHSLAEAEEAIFMAFELHRLDVLSTSQMFPASTYLGAPMRGSETDKAFTLLLSRIATLGTFRHREIGFTGPLSRHLLAYQQVTAAVRGSLRDLVEVHALSMLVSNTASRDLSPEDLTAFGCNLPFVREPDLGLSLVVKSYLDELSNEPSKRADITRWFNHAEDISGDLEKAWKMWGAVCSSFKLFTHTGADILADQRRHPGCRQRHREQRHQDHVQASRRVAPTEAVPSKRTGGQRSKLSDFVRKNPVIAFLHKNREFSSCIPPATEAF